MTLTVIMPKIDDNKISKSLRQLTKDICTKKGDYHPNEIGGSSAYGVTYENDVFAMHPYCWCDKDDCPWCAGDAPNFLHKKTGATITWYKYIGRSMEISDGDWTEIFNECFESIK